MYFNINTLGTEIVHALVIYGGNSCYILLKGEGAPQGRGATSVKNPVIIFRLSEI